MAEFEGISVLLGGVVGAGFGGGIAWMVLRSGAIGTRREAERAASALLEKAEAKAGERAKDLELDAERKISRRRESFDADLERQQQDLRESESRLDRRSAKLDDRTEKISNQEEQAQELLAKRESAIQEVHAARDQLSQTRDDFRVRLEGVAGLSEDEAREQFFEEVREAYRLEALEVGRDLLEAAEEEAKDKAREITLMAIQRCAAEHVAESTVRSVKIPSDDMKGRIIGREGRNIRAIELATGVDVLIDDSPGVIAVSCFDPVRRAVAAETLSRMVADGRVNPTKVDEYVAKAQADIDNTIRKKGQDAVIETGIKGLSKKVVQMMGRLHFRTSYGQNVLRHSIEVAFLSQMIAEQLGFDGTIARRAGFLHDIGKAMDHEVEGGHPAIGMDFAKRNGESSEYVLNAIGGHHGDIEIMSPYTPIVMAADALSGARPGARRESMDAYIKRLEELESIARNQPGVREAHAFQAGREVRVVLQAEDTTDAQAWEASRAIAKEVEDRLTFPGEIKVTVVREVKAETLAR
ncbi:MAG: ribonuclease Y [Phycisphaerae bacterium]|nr:ribonuclease Y [Phycisphaerae bacterium]